MPVSPFTHARPRHATRAPGLLGKLVDGAGKILDEADKFVKNNAPGIAQALSLNRNKKGENNPDSPNSGGHNSDNGGNDSHSGSNGPGGKGPQDGNGPHMGGNDGTQGGGGGGGGTGNNPPPPQPPTTTPVNGGTGHPGSPGGPVGTEPPNTISSDAKPAPSATTTTTRDEIASSLGASDSPHASATPPSTTPVSAAPSSDLGAHPSSLSIITGTQTDISTSATTSPSPQAATSGDPNRGAVAGGILGVLFLLFLLVAAFVFYRRRRRNRVAPSAEFLSHSAAYPFARAGFGNTAGGASTGAGTLEKGLSDTGTGAAGWNRFRALGADSSEGILSEKQPVNMSQFSEKPPDLRAQQPQPSLRPRPPPPPPIEIGEVLYSTPVPGAPQGSSPGTPTTPSGRRIPFGTGTFQFPPRTQEQ